MNTPKKNTSKSAASLAPATKIAAPKTVAKKKTPAAATAPIPAPASILTPVTESASVPAPASGAAPAAVATLDAIAPARLSAIAAPAASAPALQPIVIAPALTTITARVDVGYGNALFLRGEGPGLSWEKGRAMDCVADDQWRIELPESARTCTFKFLINDIAWSTGPDFTAESGTKVTFAPAFG